MLPYIAYMDPMGSSSKFSADDLSGKSPGLLRPQQVGILKTSPENPIGFADGIGYAATLKKMAMASPVHGDIPVETPQLVETSGKV